MASVSGYGGGRQPRSGGKIVRTRRTAVARTPYDRPALESRNSARQNPNWFSRLVYNPTRVIASSAGKFISSVLFSDSSSSSSSSSDADSASDVDADDAIMEKNTDSPEDETMEENNGALEMNKDPVIGLQPIIRRNTTKQVIEQLIMRETFAREECDRLTDIIKARVVNHPTGLATEERHGGFPDNGLISDANAPDMSTKAVMEARKWLEEKKSGSGSKVKSGEGSPFLDPFVLPHATEDDVGSPIDMAKSYMRARPPWASPSTNHAEYRSPSSTGMQLFKDGAPFSYSGSHFSSSKGSHSARSWNIQEEIRKVRAKATEEMLRSVSSPKNDWTGISWESKHGTNAVATDMLKVDGREMVRPCVNVADAALNADGGASSSCQVVQNVHDECQNQTLPNPVTSISEHNQTVEPDKAAERTGTLHAGSVSSASGVGDCLEETLNSTRGVKPSEDMNAASQSGTGAPDVEGRDGDADRMIEGATHDAVILALGVTPDPTENKDTSGTGHSILKEGGGTGEPRISNGFPPPAPSVPTTVDPQTVPCPAKESNRASSLNNEPDENPDIEEKSQLMTETLVDIPVTNGSEAPVSDENHSIASPSQNSSSTCPEWLPDETSLLNSTSSSPGNNKVVGYSRRGRGRGRSRGRGRGRGKGKQTTP